jgi:dolichol-phosphate mannosyltransferase
MEKDTAKDLSLVIPVYNEEENLRPLAEEIRAALDGTGLDYEAMFIDDGSKDEQLRLPARAGDRG